jgi:hypothetical protein
MARRDSIRTHGLFSRTMPSWQHAKSADYIYGANEEGIDTGIIIEGEGTLFLGKTSLQEMAEVMGWEVRTGWQELERDYQETIAYLEHELELSRAQVAEQEEDLRAFGKVLARAAEK